MQAECHAGICPGDEFTIAGTEYWTDSHGAIHQKDLTVRQVYDRDYVAARYDSIPVQVDEMSHLRAGYVLGAVGSAHRLLDVGYGNGKFMRVMQAFGSECTGLDISGYPVPEGAKEIGWSDLQEHKWDLACFFDSLEHLPDLSFLERLRTHYLITTVPWCQNELGIDWFEAWKHRRPGEHLHHWNPATLDRFMRAHGFRLRQCVILEDVIRRSDSPEHPNTFTALFQAV